MKSKKVLTILLALAIMVTFMPMMAFAAESRTVVWNDTYTSVSINGKSYDQIKKTWEDGQVTADVDYDKYSTATAPSPKLVDDEKGVYYDLANSEINGPSIMSRSEFETAVGTNTDGTLTWSAGFNLKDGITTTPKNAVKFADPQYTTTYKYTGFDKENLGEQTVTITAVVNPKSSYSGVEREKLAKALVGTIPTKTVKVQAAVQGYSDAKFDFDAISKNAKAWGANLSMAYDGDAHTIVNSPVDGWTYTYALQDESGKYNAVSGGVSVKDVKSYNVKVTATYKDTTKATQNAYITVTVTQASRFTFGFKDMKHETNNYTPVPAGADPYDFVTVKDVKDADAEAAMAYFKEKYTINVSKSASDSSVLTWTIADKKGYNATEAGKTYKSLLDNYANAANDSYRTDFGLNYGSNSVSVTVVEAKPAVVANDQDDDITFSGVTKYVYTGKKAIKKGKLKKNQTIAVTAVADSGNEITFSAKTSNKKITVDPATGKITVKKGLKKGTYKVEVKAKTAAGNGYKAANATATYTIVVKKK